MALVFRISDEPSQTMCLVREEKEKIEKERETKSISSICWEQSWTGSSCGNNKQPKCHIQHTLNTHPDPTTITPPHDQRVKEVGGVSTDRKATCVSLLGKIMEQTLSWSKPRRVHIAVYASYTNKHLPIIAVNVDFIGLYFPLHPKAYTENDQRYKTPSRT
ncbi:hypothetical protein WUBG_10314 [Wuchereria bancrofti]|uniref:Uncharacterized protein n=1 Tax=Wuchereria bancrofti TaxID=6293 RepID=J9EP11_WUCBA|nr:hypothetical protein WUBG_10314 [Wuchereria bancrofti]